MPGNCYSCATTFGVFKKELGCKNCGFAFCKDCLTKKAHIPKCKNEKHKVCNKCFDILTGKVQPQDANPKYSPPAAYVKRMAALEQRESQPASSNVSHPGPSKEQKKNAAKYKGMSKEDIAIAQRLEALKESQKAGQPPVPSQKEMEERLSKLRDDGKPPPPSSHEMEDRLAKLKGIDPATASKPHVFQPDRRSEQQQIDDLLDEIGDEVNIDNYGASGTTTSSEFENNLNKTTNDPDKSYNKNISVPSQQPQQGASEEDKDDGNIDLQEMQRLMESVAKEMEIDAERALQGLQKDKELMDRLQKLKQKDKNENPAKMDTTEDTTTAVVGGVGGGAVAAEDSDDENDEEVIKRIIKQHLEEAKLEDELNEAEITADSKDDVQGSKKRKVKNTDGSPDYESDPEEFPWCCICNEDATLRCYDCDGDLYCRRCFREGHDKLDLQEHRTATFKQKK